MADCFYYSVNEKNGVRLLKFNVFSKYSEYISHGFTTRDGGVSQGEYSSLNLGYFKDDSKVNVKENFMRLSEAVGFNPDYAVCSRQVHGSEIKCIKNINDCTGIDKEGFLNGYDGFATDVPGAALVTFHADCVPVFFFDPVRKAAGLVHSGWRGTFKGISAQMVKIFASEFSSRPSDILAAIGPAVQKCCFEVDKDVYLEFFKKHGSILNSFCQNNNTKFKIDLTGLIKSELIDHGLRAENIENCGICTMCKKDDFFSHRGHKGRTGTLAAVIKLNTGGVS